MGCNSRRRHRTALKTAYFYALSRSDVAVADVSCVRHMSRTFLGLCLLILPIAAFRPAVRPHSLRVLNVEREAEEPNSSQLVDSERKTILRDAMAAIITARKSMAEASGQVQLDASATIDLETELEDLMHSLETTGDDPEGEKALFEAFQLDSEGEDASLYKKRKMDEFGIMRELMKKMDSDDFKKVFLDKDLDKENPIIGEIF